MKVNKNHVSNNESVTEDSEVQEECAKVAYTLDESGKSYDWYFDSGCSRHMHGNHEILAEFSPMKGGKVTFEDGKQGRIQGVGFTENSKQPHLVNRLLSRRIALCGVPQIIVCLQRNHSWIFGTGNWDT